MWDISLFPESASTIAGEVDRLTFTLTALSLFFALPVAGLLIYFAFKYHRGSPADRSGALETSVTLEAVWIGAPLVLGLGLFAWGAGVYVWMYELPDDGLDIYVVGKQWMWQFEHPSGQREINELHVPVGSTVRLTMISQDVIHSFFVPAFRVKRDVLPGRFTTLWFEATRTGVYHLFCAEYCGTEHSRMIGSVIVVEPRQYQEWLSLRPLDLADPIPERAGRGESATRPGENGGDTLASGGEALFRSLGCSSCHVAGGGGAGPPLAGLFGREVTLANDETLVADAEYIRRSIIEPNAHVVAGYPPIMPTYEGQIGEEELVQLLEYIRGLGEE